MAPLGLGDVGSRLNQPRHLQLRATEQSSIAPSSPSTFSSLSFFFLLILLPFLSLLSFLFLSLSRLPSRLDSDPSQTRITRDTLLPTPFQRTAARFFSLSFSLSSLSLSPRQRFRLFSRGFLLSSIRALPSARQPPRFDTSIGLWGTWRRGSLSSRLSSGIAPFLRVVTSASSNICEKNIRSKYLNEDGGA